jgi:hypothetical protein
LKDGTIKEKGIRWLALNGGIRWLALNGEIRGGGGVSLNERGRGGEWTGGYEGAKTFERGTFGILGAGRIILILGDCIGAFSRGEIGKLYFWFLA